MRYRTQLDESDCGAACLAMISSFFGKNLSIAEIRNDASTDISGTNINGLLIAAKKYGLKGIGVKGKKESLNKDLKVPFIAHMHILRGESVWIDHYVIVKRIFSNKIEIWDPDPFYKKQKLTIENFAKYWTGYAIFFESDIDFQNNGNKENLLFKFRYIFLPYKKELIFSFICSLLLLFFGIIISFYYKYIFDEVIYSKSVFSLHSLSIGIICVTAIQSIITCIRSILLSHFSYKSDLQLNFSYLNHIFNLPLTFFESRKTGEILSRLSDLRKITQTISTTVLSGVMDLVMMLVSGPILVGINIKLFSIAAGTVIIIAIFSLFFSKIYKYLYLKNLSQNSEVQSYLYEIIKGASTVKAFNAEANVNETYEKKMMKAVNTSWKLNGYGISQELISGIINGISGILVFWIGCSSIITESMSFGTLITFNSLLGYFTGPLYRLVNIQNSVNEAFVAAERVGEILELETEKNDNRKYVKPLNIRGNIKFEKVTFSYGNRQPIYENLDFEIPPNSWTGFVGPSGSGKSTFAKMLLKFYEAKKGNIYIDGIDINDIDTTWLRNKIGYVPQEVHLFSGTIIENIAIENPNISFQDIISAAKKAGADEFIQKLPKRYETVLGENGCGLSGGEKQRLAIARALLGTPSLLILDEATSNLDSVSEMKIHEVIRNLRSENISVVLIAHRLTTVMDCNNIFVFENGNIVEQGNHRELLKKNGLYKQMWFGDLN